MSPNSGNTSSGSRDRSGSGVDGGLGNSLRGSTKLLLAALLAAVGLTGYLLVATHVIHMPNLGGSSDGNTDSGSGIGGSGNSGGARPAVKMTLADFTRYDANQDGSLSKDEFERLLINLHLGTHSVGSGAGTAATGSSVLKAPAFPPPGSAAVNAAAAAAAKAAVQRASDKEAKAAGDRQSEAERLKAEAERSKAEAEQSATEKAEAAADEAASADAEKAADDSAAEAAAAADEKVAADRAAAQKAAAAVAAATASGSGSNGTQSGCPQLSRELVASFAKNNTIMLTVTDWRIFETFGINWMKHLAKLGVDYWLVGATDALTGDFLSHTGRRHPCFAFIEEGMEKAHNNEYAYGDRKYNAATWRKVTVVERIVDWGFNVIHSDVDVVWFRDPLPYMLGPALEGVDWAVSTDLISTHNPEGDNGLEIGIHQQCNVNTGIYFCRASPGGQRFMAGWAGLREKFSHENDQIGVYNHLRNRPAIVKRRIMTLEPNHSIPMHVGFLSTAVMLNGYSYFIPRLNKFMKTDALGLHLTWVPLSREGKFHRMRDGMLYYDKPEYYSGPKFMTADLDYPPMPEDYNKWQDTEKMIQFHLEAMRFQERQVYRAMAVAVLLNRTLILPRMKCYCNKNWFMSEQCRIPGDKVTQFPFDCTLDQWLRPKVLYAGIPINGSTSFGPSRPFAFREYSMLENERTPPEVKESAVVVLTKGAPPETVVAPSNGSVISVARHIKEKALVSALAPLTDAPLLRFANVTEAFGGFEDMALQTSFEAFLDKAAANWCCRDEPFIAKGMARKVKLAIKWQYPTTPTSSSATTIARRRRFLLDSE